MYENARNAVLQNNFVTDIDILVPNFTVKHFLCCKEQMVDELQMIAALILMDMKDLNVPCAMCSYFTLKHLVHVRNIFALKA